MAIFDLFDEFEAGESIFDLDTASKLIEAYGGQAGVGGVATTKGEGC
jgi:hypothetical protein